MQKYQYYYAEADMPHAVACLVFVRKYFFVFCIAVACQVFTTQLTVECQMLWHARFSPLTLMLSLLSLQMQKYKYSEAGLPNTVASITSIVAPITAVSPLGSGCSLSFCVSICTFVLVKQVN